jgi:hypothetical protein
MTEFASFLLKRWRYGIFGVLMAGVIFLMNYWHYRPIKKLENDLKEQAYKIEFLEIKNENCQSKVKALTTELEICEDTMTIYDQDQNESTIKDTLKDGYVIF